MEFKFSLEVVFTYTNKDASICVRVYGYEVHLNYRKIMGVDRKDKYCVYRGIDKT